MAIRQKLANTQGQMTVELCVVLPVVLLVALIGVNAMSCFVACTSFDREAKATVRLVASSPCDGLDNSALAASVEEALAQNFNTSNSEVFVSVLNGDGATTSFVMTFRYYPTLFGIGIRDELFGVSLPAITHNVQHDVEIYRVGKSIRTVF